MTLSPALIVCFPAALAPHPTCFPFSLEAETFRDPNSVVGICNLRHLQIVNRCAPVIAVQIPWFSDTRYLKSHLSSLLKNQGKPQQDDSMQFCITGKRKPCRYEIRPCKILSQRNLALLHPPSIMVLFLQQLYQMQHPDIVLSSYQFSREVWYHYKQF